MSDDLKALAATASLHSDALFGRSLTPSALRVEPIAKGTRGVYRVGPLDGSAPPLVAKRRTSASEAEHRASMVQTSHEFALMTAVRAAMTAAGRADHTVPRAVLALADEGLIFMEQAGGGPVAHELRRWIVGGRSSRLVSELARRCGEWLHTFTVRAPRAAWPAVDADAETTLRAGRARHHIYCLIGLSGAELPGAMLGQVTRRLEAYRVDTGFRARLERALLHQLTPLAAHDPQGNAHGKYSVADVFADDARIVPIDLEQAGNASLYLDAAYFLFQLAMSTRWRPIGARRAAAGFRASFLRGRSPAGELDERVIDAFIGYYLVNSLRPGDGIAGMTARAYARQWLEDWLRRAGA